ncbi:hypothetical protein NMY22_g18529 [Coprinellus aureogranulatus]|nr:hypothetical protein NMY22_g18529 [Coprinellus aureogranulatus]
MSTRLNTIFLTLALALTTVTASPLGGSPKVHQLGALYGYVAGTISEPVGITCSPLNSGAIGGNACQAQTACCTGNDYHNGGLVVGCSPMAFGN